MHSGIYQLVKRAGEVALFLVVTYAPQCCRSQTQWAVSLPTRHRGFSTKGGRGRQVWGATAPNRYGTKKKRVAFGGTRTHANKVDYDLNVAP